MKKSTKDKIVKTIYGSKITQLAQCVNEIRARKHDREDKNQLWLAEKSNHCVILDKGMGDFLLFMPYFMEIIDYYQNIDEKIYVICNDYNAEFLKLLGDSINQINIVKINKKQLSNLYDYVGFFNTIILPFETIRKYHFEILRLLRPCNVYAVGKKIKPLELSKTDMSYLAKIKTFEETGQGFYSERHRRFTENFLSKQTELKLAKLKTLPRIINGKYYVINVGASTNPRVWPLEKVVALIEMIKSKSLLQPIIIGNVTESQKMFLKENGIEDDFLNIKDINKLLAIIQDAEFVLTNDTGAYHLSACLKKKTYVISSGAYSALFLPYPPELSEDRVKYISPDFSCDTCNVYGQCYLKRRLGLVPKCLDAISPQLVFDQIFPH